MLICAIHKPFVDLRKYHDNLVLLLARDCVVKHYSLVELMVQD